MKQQIQIPALITLTLSIITLIITIGAIYKVNKLTKHSRPPKPPQYKIICIEQFKYIKFNKIRLTIVPKFNPITSQPERCENNEMDKKTEKSL